MLTAEQLRDLLDYDAETGIFRWKIQQGRALVGQSAGYKNGMGYLQVKIDGRRHQAHRLAWLCVHGVWPTGNIDHIDGNRANNRIANLREATKSENGWNRGLPANNTSGFKGVNFCKRKERWRAMIMQDGRRIHLGYFLTPTDAHAAYARAATDMHGEFARVA